MIDYHLHGNFSGHGSGALEEYVKAAIDKGFSEIGFSDHLPKVIEPDPYHAMPLHRLPVYIREIRRLQRKYEDSITIKLGVEADFFDGYEDRTSFLLSSYPFDYVMGSVHFLGDWHFTSREGRERYGTEDPDESFPKYFDLLERMIRTGIFDILAHPDALKKESFRPSASSRGRYVRIAELLREKGMSLEVNTAGLRRGAGSVYPDREFLDICVKRGVPLTLGSDAHTPEEVGMDYDSAMKLLSSVTGCKIARYRLRKRSEAPLGEFEVARPAS